MRAPTWVNWLTFRPEVRRCYAPRRAGSRLRPLDELQRQGKTAQEAAATIASLKAIGDRAEIERWNKILTSPKPRFNKSPNAFLVEMVKG